MNDDQVRKILDALPKKVSRSRLEPYRELIRQLRRRRRTYREIAQLLGEHCQLRISVTAVHKFVERNLRRKQTGYKPQETGSIASTHADRKVRMPAGTEKLCALKNQTYAPGEPVWERIAELKQQPLPDEATDKEFH